MKSNLNNSLNFCDLQYQNGCWFTTLCFILLYVKVENESPNMFRERRPSRLWSSMKASEPQRPVIKVQRASSYREGNWTNFKLSHSRVLLKCFFKRLLKALKGQSVIARKYTVDSFPSIEIKRDNTWKYLDLLIDIVFVHF